MPDWSYHTLFRPLLFHLPAPKARALTLRALGALGSHRLGPQLIALMGHTRPAPSLTTRLAGISLASPVGISADLPGNERALASLSRFGVGYVEVGPVALTSRASASIVRVPQQEAIAVDGESHTSVGQLAAQLAAIQPLPTQVFARLSHRPDASAEDAAAERVALITRLAPFVAAFTLTPPPARWSAVVWRDHLAAVVAAATAHGRPLFVGIVPDDPTAEDRVVEPAITLGVAGVMICGTIGTSDGASLLGVPAQAAALRTTTNLRSRWGESLTMIAAGGIQEPSDAMALLHAGASGVQLDAGLVYAGPGLPKRINEAIRYQHESPLPLSYPQTLAGWLHAGWFWLLLLGVGMVISGIMAWIVAATSVVLPYDEAFVGIARDQFSVINTRLLDFMAHDRVSLAGTMISIGVVYGQLAWHGLRRQIHWTRQAITLSASVGFLSVFLFVGYGYVDPLHASLSLLLLPFLLLGLRGQAEAPPDIPVPDLHNDRRWRLAQIGQFGIISLGLGLIVAGLAIAFVGVTTVFVPQDLRFLCTTTTALQTANERLVALIAHDRAGFGGALVSDGVAVLLIGLWGVRRGAGWVWWTLVCGGVPGFVTALGVHVTIGYLDWWHLLPAIVALAIYTASMGLLYPYMSQSR